MRLYWYSFPANILIENGVSKDGVSLVSEIMKSNPADRITVATALHHSWTSIQEPKPMSGGNISSENYREEKPDEKSQIKDSPIQLSTSVPLDGHGGILELDPLFLGAIIPSSASNQYQSLKDLQIEDVAHLETQSVDLCWKKKTLILLPRGL